MNKYWGDAMEQIDRGFMESIRDIEAKGHKMTPLVEIQDEYYLSNEMTKKILQRMGLDMDKVNYISGDIMQDFIDTMEDVIDGIYHININVTESDYMRDKRERNDKLKDEGVVKMEYKFDNNNDGINKSWSIGQSYVDDNGSMVIPAVDSITGERLGTLWIYHEIRKNIVSMRGIKTQLEYSGYDPFQHGNTFEQDGSIKTREWGCE